MRLFCNTTSLFILKYIIVYILLSVLYTIIINQLYSISTIFFSFHLVKSNKKPLMLCCYVMLCMLCLLRICSHAIGDSLQYDRGRTSCPLVSYSSSIGNVLSVRWERTGVVTQWNWKRNRAGMHKKAPKVRMITGIGGTSLTFGAFWGFLLRSKSIYSPFYPY